MKPIRIALTKGRLEEKSIEMFEALGYDCSEVRNKGRRLVLPIKNANIEIVGIEPDTSAVLSGKEAGAHKLQGIGAGFVPDVLNTGIYDEIIPATEENAYETARLLGCKEGILCGISGGASLWAAIELAKRNENEGKTIVVLLPDSGERYLSTEMFNFS